MHTADSIGFALTTVMTPPPALIDFVRGTTASPGLMTKARAVGLSTEVAELACATMTRVIRCMDEAARLRRGSGYARAKLLETALDACRPPVSDALKVAMVACPVDGRAMLRLWCEVADMHERGAMLDMLRES